MKHLKLLLAACLVTCYFGCKKKEEVYTGPTLATGQAVNEKTGRAVPNAIVALYKQKSGSFSAWGIERISEQMTDENGHFSFTLQTVGSDSIYFLRATANQYFKSAESYIGKNKKNENIQLILYPYGYVRFYVKDMLPKDTLYNLSIGFNIIGEPVAGINYVVGDTILYGYRYGGMFNQFGYSIRKKGQLAQNFKDSIYLIPLDTVEYTIFY